MSIDQYLKDQFCDFINYEQSLLVKQVKKLETFHTFHHPFQYQFLLYFYFDLNFFNVPLLPIFSIRNDDSMIYLNQLDLLHTDQDTFYKFLYKDTYLPIKIYSLYNIRIFLLHLMLSILYFSKEEVLLLFLNSKLFISLQTFSLLLFYQH